MSDVISCERKLLHLYISDAIFCDEFAREHHEYPLLLYFFPICLLLATGHAFYKKDKKDTSSGKICTVAPSFQVHLLNHGLTQSNCKHMKLYNPFKQIDAIS